MQKEKFLELAGKLFDETNVVAESNKVVIDKNLLLEIIDRVSSQITECGKELIDDYELEMYRNEVSIESVDINHGYVEDTVAEVLNRYFAVA